MSTKFNFKSQICTSREQSERLLALGLKPETADMLLSKVRVFNNLIDFMSPHNWTSEQSISDTWYPAWSLHRLIEMNDINPFIFYTNCGYDNVVDRIEELIKEGYFNKEYLEE